MFISWIGDHRPCHVRVYRDGVLVLKWNLEKEVLMKGRWNSRVIQLIKDLQREGRL